MGTITIRTAAVFLLATLLLGLALSAGAAPETPSAEKIKELVKQLGDEQFSVREAATKELIDIGRPAVAAVREAAKSTDPEVRHRARRVLDSIQTNVKNLIEDLKDKDPAVRKEAAEALEQMGPKAKEAIPALVEGLKDKDEAARDAIILAILSIDPANKDVGDAAPRKASVNGKYRKLLRRINVPQDKNGYGEFSDYGQYSGTSYAGFNNLPAGYWVYVAPHWYIWGELTK